MTSSSLASHALSLSPGLPRSQLVTAALTQEGTHHLKGSGLSVCMYVCMCERGGCAWKNALEAKYA